MRSLKPFAVMIALLAATAVLAGPARASVERGIVLSYEMWQGGLQPFKIEFRIADSKTGYRAALLAETSGVVGWAYPYRVQSLSEGRFSRDGLNPDSYRSTMRKPGKERLRWINYGTDGRPEAGFDPPRKGTSDDEPTEAEIAGTVDPISGLVAVIDRVRDSGRCAGVVPVYDGKKVFHLQVTDQGTKRLESNEYGVFNGKATVCRVQVKRVAGFRKKKRNRFGLRYLPEDLDIWFAPAVAGHGPVPVRIEGKADLGQIVIHLVKVDRNPSTWEAMLPKDRTKGRPEARENERSNHR